MDQDFMCAVYWEAVHRMFSLLLYKILITPSQDLQEKNQTKKHPDPGQGLEFGILLFLHDRTQRCMR